MKPGIRVNVVEWEVTVKKVGVKMQREGGITRVRRVLNVKVRDLCIPWECSLVFSWVRVGKVAVGQFQVGQRDSQI